MIFCLILSSLPTACIIQKSKKVNNDDYYNPKQLRYNNNVYRSDIKTPRLYLKGEPLSEPMLRLNSNEQLELSFDLLKTEAEVFSYTFIHCNADWQPSDLDPFDYIDGFLRDDIDRYEYSFRTKQDYVHYRLVFPNNNIRFRKLGNYLLKVYANDNPDDIVLTRRLMVYENVLDIDVSFLSSNLNQYYRSHQRLDFSLSTEGTDIGNPMEEIKIVLMQNGRWDNIISGLKPLFIRGHDLVYNYTDRTLFPGGDEFRFFDTRSLRQTREGVKQMNVEGTENHFYLKPDLVRGEKKRIQVSFTDLNGKYLIGQHDGGIFTNLDADYGYVHFQLKMDSVIQDGNLYVFGGFNDWQITPETLLHYDYQTKTYYTKIFLKQGKYDYQYVLVRDNEKKKQADASITEGNYVTTENTYHILVYHRAFNSRYDRLVGLRMINTRR